MQKKKAPINIQNFSIICHLTTKLQHRLSVSESKCKATEPLFQQDKLYYHMHSQCNRQVERVKSSFPLNNGTVSFQSEVSEVYLSPYWCSSHVQTLACDCLHDCLHKKSIININQVPTIYQLQSKSVDLSKQENVRGILLISVFSTELMTMCPKKVFKLTFLYLILTTRVCSFTQMLYCCVCTFVVMFLSLYVYIVHVNLYISVYFYKHIETILKCAIQIFFFTL